MTRNKIKGPFFKENLITQDNKKYIKIFNKNLIILPEYINLFFNIYNGRNFIKLKIDENMVGYKFGEFIRTRKKFSYKKKK